MRTRFSTNTGKKLEKANFRKLPKALYLAIMRKYFKQYPVLPWIPFSAIDHLNNLIKPNWKVLEIGSGMSTLWLAKRSEKVISIEADKNWFDKLGEMIYARKFTNIDLRFEWEREKIADFSEFKDHEFDLIYIDGGPRELCCINAYAKLKNGGYIYFDNSDSSELCGNAVVLLKEYTQNSINKIFEHVDLVPGNFMVNEGLLIQKPAN